MKIHSVNQRYKKNIIQNVKYILNNPIYHEVQWNPNFGPTHRKNAAMF